MYVDGNITCIFIEGKGLDDYIIALTSLFDKCTYFCIGIQSFSDHFLIIRTLQLHALIWLYQIVIMRILLAVGRNTNGKIHLKWIFQ